MGYGPHIPVLIAEILHQFLEQSFVELGMDNRIWKYYARDVFESFILYTPNFINAASAEYGFDVCLTVHRW